MKKIILIICTIILTSCSNNELTRDKANELILNNNFQKELTEEVIPYLNTAKKMKMFGYLDYDFSETRRNYYLSNFKLKGDATNYLISEKKQSDGDPIYIFRIGEQNIGKITGVKIDEEKTKATVEYTVEKRYNLFSKNLLKKTDKVENLTAYFELYDDGWRIK